MTKTNKHLEDKIKKFRDLSNKCTELECKKLELESELDLIHREYNHNKCKYANDIEAISKELNEIKQVLSNY